MLTSCAPTVSVEEDVIPETEPTPLPTVTPTPEPQAGESYDHHRELVTCRVNENKKGYKGYLEGEIPYRNARPDMGC